MGIKKCHANFAPCVVGKVHEEDGIFYLNDGTRDLLIREDVSNLDQSKKMMRNNYPKKTYFKLKALIGKTISVLGILTDQDIVIKSWVLND